MSPMIRGAVLATALLVAGCASIPRNDDVVQQVRDITVATCKFLPTVGTVLDILAGGQLSGPLAIAAAICQAVAPQAYAAPRRSTAPVVQGVKVRGRFVR